jgi:hypothetical protein
MKLKQSICLAIFLYLLSACEKHSHFEVITLTNTQEFQTDTIRGSNNFIDSAWIPMGILKTFDSGKSSYARIYVPVDDGYEVLPSVKESNDSIIVYILIKNKSSLFTRQLATEVTYAQVNFKYPYSIKNEYFVTVIRKKQ